MQYGQSGRRQPWTGHFHPLVSEESRPRFSTSCCGSDTGGRMKDVEPDDDVAEEGVNICGVKGEGVVNVGMGTDTVKNGA